MVGERQQDDQAFGGLGFRGPRGWGLRVLGGLGLKGLRGLGF